MRQISLSEEQVLIINPSGKKMETLDSALYEMRDFIVTGKVPLLTFATQLKPEIIFERNAKYNFSTYVHVRNTKGRLFIIPNHTAMIMSRMVSLVAMLYERGDKIRIGQTWSAGGMDDLLKALLYNQGPRVIVEGDFRKLDLTIKDILIQMVKGRTMAYFKRAADPELFDFMEIICEVLAEQMSVRIQHLFGTVWVRIVGNLASGTWETSHLGSLVVQFLWWLYITIQLDTLPRKDRNKMLLVARDNVSLVNYSDDHLLSVPDDPLLLEFFSYAKWCTFLNKWFKMEVRDVFYFRSVFTEVNRGVITKKGPCFLQHYAIRNPRASEPGQPFSLPFRATDVVLIRLAHGREPKERDLLDLVLGCLGHAYGTYAANQEVYDIIRLIYSRALNRAGPDALSRALSKCSTPTLAKFRQQNISDEELVFGFPTIEKLILKNTYDPSVHQKRYQVDNMFDETF